MIDQIGHGEVFRMDAGERRTKLSQPPTTRYLAPQRFKTLNSSLKCEFGVTLLLPLISFDHHLPRGGEDRCGPLALPELDIKRPVTFADLAKALHNQ